LLSRRYDENLADRIPQVFGARGDIADPLPQTEEYHFLRVLIPYDSAFNPGQRFEAILP
jgi:hypothetical protein